MMKDLTPDKMADFSAWERDNEPSATITAEQFDKMFDDGEEDITGCLEMHNIDVFTSRNSHPPDEIQESLNNRKESDNE